MENLKIFQNLFKVFELIIIHRTCMQIFVMKFHVYTVFKALSGPDSHTLLQGLILHACSVTILFKSCFVLF